MSYWSYRFLTPTLNTYYEIELLKWLIVIVVELLLKQRLLVYLYMLTDIVEKRMRYRLKNYVGVVFINHKELHACCCTHSTILNPACNHSFS